MTILMILAFIYLAIGLVYALYILLFAGDVWYWFPVNWALGPLFIVFNFIAELRRPKTIL